MSDLSPGNYATSFDWAQVCTTDLERRKTLRSRGNGKGILTDTKVLSELSNEERCRQLWAAVLNQALDDVAPVPHRSQRKHATTLAEAHDEAQRFAFAQDGAWARSRNEILAILDIPTSSYQATARAVHNGAIDLRYGA